jgi:two-component system chemotaxis sensor kinase CheA
MTPDHNILNEFLAEAKEHLAMIEAGFLALEDKGNQKDPSHIGSIFRAVHSIKGSSSFLNLKPITELAHEMEALIQKFRDASLEINENHIDALLEGVDLLSRLLDDPLNTQNISIMNACDHIRNIDSQTSCDQENDTNENNIVQHSSQVKTSDKNEIPEISESSLEETLDHLTFDQLNNLNFVHPFTELPTARNLFILKFNIFDIESDHNILPVQFIFDFSGLGTIIDIKTDIQISSYQEITEKRHLVFEILYETKINKSELSLLLNLGDHSIICIVDENDKKSDTTVIQKTSQSKIITKPQESAHTKKPQASSNSKKQEQKKSARMPETAKTKETDATSKPSAHVKPVSVVKPETIRIGIDILDRIMNLAGELVLVRNQHMLVIDKQNSRQSDIAQRLDMVTTELQEAIMRTRMQPIGNLFSKLPRIVRDLGKKLSKSIVVITKGDDVELDRNILESLSDPLIHIIRNACDHGIEFPNDRIQIGKSETGYIKVHAYHEAGQINITIEDDGKGLDPDRIKEIALEREVKTKHDIHLMSENELIKLIMLPGFSTAHEATEVSGRGVGMDVVKNAVEDMNGSIDMHSEKNHGTTIHLRLPLTLAIIPSLIVLVNNERLAIPEVNVEELVSLYDKEILTEIETNGDQEVFRLRKYLLPLVRLNEVLARKEAFSESVRFEISEKYSQTAQKKLHEETEDLEEILIFAVLKFGNQRFGVIVDEVLGTEEIVVNPIHSLVKNIKIFSGTTIMGDGTVALILDVNGIVNHCGLIFSNYSEKRLSKGAYSNQSDTHRILLFESGPNEQFAVPLLLLKRVEIINADEVQMIGDREYISIDNKTIQIVRLDKILNVSSITENKRLYLLIPKQSPQSFGLIASRLIDVINMPLELNKEDFDDEGFLGTALIEKKITLFIDIYKIIQMVFPNNIPESRHEIKEVKQNNASILLVEDTVFFRRLIEGQLSGEGFHVKTAENGVKALEILEKETFDIIVSDIEMPEMDGLTLIKTLRKNEKFKHIPAIAVTSLDSQEDREKGLKAGFNAYEVKINKERLLNNIQNLLNSKGN